jgi:hypothetical protein
VDERWLGSRWRGVEVPGKEEWLGTHRRRWGREERWRSGVWSAAGCSGGWWWPSGGPATVQRKGEGEEWPDR